VSDGTIEQHNGRVTFRYERRIHHPVDVVWKAITDPSEIARWSGSRPEIDLQLGGHYISYHGNGERVVDRILRLDPPRLFEHTYWVHVNPTAVVSWELSPIEEGCLLVLTHSLGMDDIRAAAATVARGNDFTVIVSRNGAGWHRLLDKLEATLDGHSTDWSEEAQRALQARYAAMLA
jgi:uncharacterized protein YndB with AHSA1/START domain